MLTKLTPCIRLVLLCIFAALQASAASAELPGTVSAHIQAVQSSYSNNEAIVLEVTYTNNGSDEIKLLKWGTALEGRINDNFLFVVFEGNELRYDGRHYKRAQPSDSDYQLMLPGQSITARVDVLDAYKLHYKGDYRISYRGKRSKSANTTTFKLNQDLPIIALSRPPRFSSCNASQQQQLNQALVAAEKIARKARDDLRSTPVSKRGQARRYREWFGQYNQVRWNQAQRNFDLIYAAARQSEVGFNCDCNESSFAFVYTNDHYNITLCNAFWPAGLIGTDSKAGTIVHELSHFNVVASTNDDAYGQRNARALANNNPSSAIANADNHEYFAENTPGLSMPKPEPDTPAAPPEPEPEPPIITPIIDLLLGG